MAIAPAAVAQNLPAGVDGYWKITKMLPKKPMATPGMQSQPGVLQQDGASLARLDERPQHCVGRNDRPPIRERR